MKNNTVKIILILLALCLVGTAGFYYGKSQGVAQGTKEAQEVRQQMSDLQELNRQSIAKLQVNDGPIYVIGHKSPDSDTICSAIAYARLLKALGYDAQAAANGTPNNESKYILQLAGVEAPPVLEDATGKNIFLVDHSEYLQATAGMSEANLVGVIDHHGIGSVTTGQQVLYDARPIGATATIIWLNYLNYGVEIDKQTATLLLGAVLSDTTNLTGSTVTEADKKAVPALAKIAEIDDIDGLYDTLHRELLSYDGMTDMEILFLDYKEYEAAGVKFGIGILNSIDEPTSKELSARMKAILPEGFETRDVDLMYASVGIRENGEKIDYIVPANEYSEAVFKAAFPNYDEYDGTAYIFRTPGLGRKSLFVPGLTEYLQSHPQE
ncbi:MAG: DHH family phosphoesterase [Erysipelotrichaceae bacterium]|nr:DHH family phosphoesterase [Erysipelotrichaceae bacterium]